MKRLLSRLGLLAVMVVGIAVAGIDLSEPLSVGDVVQFRGHTTDFTMTVESMQVEHDAVESASAGAKIGIAVAERCRRGDHVYKVTD